MSDAFWNSLGPTLAILATGAVTWWNERKKAAKAEIVAENAAVAAERAAVVAVTTASTAVKVSEIARTTAQVHETVAATASTTEVVHTLVNDRLSKALEEIKTLRDTLAEVKAAEAKSREHTAGQLRTRASDVPGRVNRRRKRRE